MVADLRRMVLSFAPDGCELSPVLYDCGLVLYGCGLGIVWLWIRCGFMPFQCRVDVGLLPLAIV